MKKQIMKIVQYLFKMEVSLPLNKDEKSEFESINDNRIEKFQLKTPKGTRDYYPQQMAVRRLVIDKIVGVFKRHGAVQIDTPVFELKDVLMGKYGEQSKLIFDLKDQGGQICSLRYDLTVPFARFMAMNTDINKIKRFHIGKVYRRDQPTATKGRFRQFYQCDFDIAGQYEPMIPDAQVLAIMQQILQELDVKDYLVKVNHRKILEAVITEAGCSPDMFKAICSSVDKLDKLPWAQVEKELLAKKVSLQQAQIIGKLTQFRGNPTQLLKQLQSTKIFGKSHEKVSQILSDMGKLFSYLNSMGRLAKISFDLSLARGLDYYTGLIYEIVLTDKKCQLGSISGGGRYDNLIGMFCQHQIPAVGGSIGIQRLFTILESKFKDRIRENQCQILVATIGNIEVGQKLQILSQLWNNQIKAETLYVEKAKPKKQLDHAFKNHIPMILWIGQQQLKNKQLKLKILYTREEVIISQDNFIQNILPFVQRLRKDEALGKVIYENKEQ